jgi:threonine dehydrogenase-like Zn-dependent dehydrogenase
MTKMLQDNEAISERALESGATVAIVGSGMMGVGIAQLAAVTTSYSTTSNQKL